MTADSTERGRVPFALVGVVLLLGSIGYANTLALAGPTGGVTGAGETLDRTEATTRPAVRSAAASAARQSAMAPVTVSADTPVGRAIDPNVSFRDALKLRIYGAVARTLSATAVDDGTTVGSASLPGANSTAEFRAAKRRIGVRPANDGTAMTVTVRNVTLTARRNGRVVGTERTTYVVTVAVPVLAMHERTRLYEERLNAGPLEGPGLGRALTWRLTAVAQARGLAQYGGVPIQNVLGNRHVELSTNAAALREQRDVFGRADPEGRAGVVHATARVGTTDLLGPAIQRGPAWTETVLSAEAAARSAGAEEPSGDTGAVSISADSRNKSYVRVGLNRTADRAFAQFLETDADRVRQRAYEARITRHVRVVSSREGTRPSPTPPGRNWTFVAEGQSRRTTVLDRTTRPRSNPNEFMDTVVTVRVTHTAVRTWRNGADFKRTHVEWRDEHRVRIRIEGEHLPPRHGPDRPISPTFVRGGALDGSNLADVRGIALERLAGRDRTDELARNAVKRGAETRTDVVEGRHSPKLEAWIYADVAHLRERMRNVSVSVPREDVAAGEANAPAALAAELRQRRSSLVGAPPTYNGAADSARIAARAAYLDRVIDYLEERAERTDDRNNGFRSAVAGADVPLSNRLDEVSGVTARAFEPEPRPIGQGLAGEVVLTPDTDPGYLTLTAVPRKRTDSQYVDGSVHLLAARNTNVFTVPSDETADAVTDAAVPERRTASLRTAGLALVRANRTLDARENETLRRQRDDLASAVSGSMVTVRGRAATVLEVRAGARLSQREREAALDAADARYSGLGARAVAATNGSYARTVAHEAAVRGEFSSMERDRLGLRLRLAVTSAASSENVAVPETVTYGTVTAERRVARSLVHDAVAGGTDRVASRVRGHYSSRAFRPVLAGLPVAPIPGYWYATVNVWSVEVRGYYPRFTVETRVGGPDGAGAILRYVRDGRTVRFDADGDGDAERIGRNEHVSFRTRTVVLVAVPAGMSGVGDVDGNADERSAGWPCPDASVPGCGGESYVGK